VKSDARRCVLGLLRDAMQYGVMCCAVPWRSVLSFERGLGLIIRDCSLGGVGCHFRSDTLSKGAVPW